VITILHGNVVVQTVLDGLIIYPPVANFLQFTCAKNYESWLSVYKVIAMKTVCSFFGPCIRYVQCESKKIPPEVFCHFFQKGWEFL